MDEFSFFFLLFVLLSFFSLFFSSSFLSFVWGCVMDDPELVMLAARLVQCAPGDVMAVRWRGDELVVVWGIGWKRVFERAEVDALAVDAVFVPEERAQMVIAPPPLTVTTEDSPLGLYALLSDRVAMTLIRAGLESPGAVRAASNDQLRAIGGIGPRTLKEIRDVLPRIED